MYLDLLLARAITTHYYTLFLSVYGGFYVFLLIGQPCKIELFFVGSPDSDLHDISEFCASLCYLNLNGCTSLTDNGLSVIILKCKKLHSVLACDTSFGNNSILALCYGISVAESKRGNYSHTTASKCQTLHIGGCNGEQHFLCPLSPSFIFSIPGK